MATSDNLKDEQDQFAAAFNEDEAPKQEMSEDEVFGLAEPKTEENAAEDGAEGRRDG